MPRPELWRSLFPFSPSTIAQEARRIEEEGWDGMVLGDTQCILPDVFVALAAAAVATTRLRLATGVANGYTRHPSVVAAASASLQELSGGRAILGLGRGDSAVAHLGLHLGTVASFDRFVDRVQRYLRGEEVPFDPEDVRPGFAALDGNRAGGDPTASRLEWLPADLPKVPVAVYASGPRMVAVGARRADRLTLALGADPARIRWGIDLARSARREAGMDPDGLEIGCMLSVLPHERPEVAMELSAGHIASMARINSMSGRPHGPVADPDKAVFDRINRSYEAGLHGSGGFADTPVLTPDFMTSFAVLGDAPTCVRRLQELAELGVAYFCVVTVGDAQYGGQPDPEVVRIRRSLVQEVLPTGAWTGNGTGF